MKRAIQNALLFQSPGIGAGNGPAPEETGQRKRWMDAPARRFLEKMSPYATDFFGAEVQGLDPADVWKTAWYEIRAADPFPSASVSETSRHSDWRTIAFRRRDIDYLPTGAKIWFWKSCWLALNPDNAGGAFPTAVVRRCNRIWKRYDYYGNLLSEPFIVERPSTQANANEYNRYQGLPDHYSSCVMQYNPETAELKENDRMVMGNAVYAVRGLSNYILDFSTEETSVRLLYFSLFFQQPTQWDDLVNQIADGKAFSWSISVDGPREMGEGQTARFTASSVRCGRTPDREVSYRWESLSSKLEAGGDGTITALSQGMGTIRCSLEQNPGIFVDVPVTVAAAGLSWASSVPERIAVYQPVTLAVRSEGAVTWSVNGPEGRYSAEEKGNALTLTACYPSGAPLVVTVTDGNRTLRATMKLTVR